MKNYFQYFFYRFYKRQRTKYDEKESIVVSSLGLSVILYLNLLTLYAFSVYIDLLPSLDINPYLAVISGLLIWLILIIFFIDRKKYKEIEKKFCREHSRENTKGLIIMIGYVIITIILFLVSINLIH
jgi:hypothetical protein